MKYTTHEEIAKKIGFFIDAHVDFQFQHNRENLDDLIADLIQYRDTLPTCDEYLEANEL